MGFSVGGINLWYYGGNKYLVEGSLLEGKFFQEREREGEQFLSGKGTHNCPPPPRPPTTYPLVKKTLEYNFKRLGHILPQSEAQEFNQDVINLLHLKTKPEYEKKTLNTKIFPKKDEFYSLLPAFIILITLILPIIAYYNLHLLWHKIKKTKTKLILFT